MTDTDDFNLWHNEPLVVVISGPSGAGKDSVIAKLKEYQRPFKFVVTATTRPPRDDEQHGVNYFFLSKDQFSEMIAREELIEYALVTTKTKAYPVAGAAGASERAGCGDALGSAGSSHRAPKMPSVFIF